MKETSFINQNKDKWRKFEKAYQTGSQNPDELSNLFIEITEDLSYAQTHYAKRTVRIYLNNLAQDVFNKLYKIKNRPFERFVMFWTKSLPLEAYRMRKDMLLALVVFFIAAGIGIVSTADNINYAKVILGDAYVNMTNQHINEYVHDLEMGRDPGSPLKVYATGSSLPDFAMIFFNNIRVGFFTFVLGILFGVGTLFFLAYNGIMVGTFQSYFYFKGKTIKSAALAKSSLLYSTFLTIWIHGAFEISALVLSAACGFTLGRSLIFPRTMTRLQSLQEGTKKGLKVFIGLSLFILLAAVLESYVTRLYSMPEWLKLFIIFGSFAIMFMVFVFVPFQVAKKYPDEIKVADNPAYNHNSPIQLYNIRSFTEVMTDAFRLYRRLYDKTFSFLWKFLLPVSLIYLWINFDYNFYYYNNDMLWYDNCSMLFGLDYFSWELTVFFWPIITGIFIAHIFYYLKLKDDKINLTKSYWQFMVQHGFEIALVFFPISLANQFLPGILMFLMMFTYPFLLPGMYGLTHHKGNYFERFGRGFVFGAEAYATGIALFWVLFLLIGIFFALFTSQVYYVLEEFLRWHLETRYENFQAIMQFIKSALFMFFYFHMIKLFALAYSLIYYHIFETRTSSNLYSKLDKFGKQNKFHESLSE